MHDSLHVLIRNMSKVFYSYLSFHSHPNPWLCLVPWEVDSCKDRREKLLIFEPFKNRFSQHHNTYLLLLPPFWDPLPILLLELERDTVGCSWVETGTSESVAGDIVIGAVAPIDLLFPMLVICLEPSADIAKNSEWNGARGENLWES